MRLISVENYPSSSYQVQINETEYDFDLKYNSVFGHDFWTLSLSIGGIPIVLNRRIKSGVPILNQFVKDFDGNFIAISNVTPEQSLGVEPWGNTHLLYLIEEDD